MTDLVIKHILLCVLLFLTLKIIILEAYGQKSEDIQFLSHNSYKEYDIKVSANTKLHQKWDTMVPIRSKHHMLTGQTCR